MPIGDVANVSANAAGLGEDESVPSLLGMDTLPSTSDTLENAVSKDRDNMMETSITKRFAAGEAKDKFLGTMSKANDCSERKRWTKLTDITGEAEDKFLGTPSSANDCTERKRCTTAEKPKSKRTRGAYVVKNKKAMVTARCSLIMAKP